MVKKIASNLNVKVVCDKQTGKVKFRSVCRVYVGDMLAATACVNGRATPDYIEKEFRRNSKNPIFKRAIGYEMAVALMAAGQC